jgi:DNA polymerase
MHPSLKTLREAAADCEGCPLYRNATQTVFGAGKASSRVMFVGEQPGDAEDLAGKPFVGPAGRVLNEALAAAGIERKSAYVTNAVKHFKWEPRGKRRLHKKPSGREIAACRPWLEEEVEVVEPEVLVCLGATAAQAILGRSFRVSKDRGKVFASDLCPRTVATVHPSSILRQPTREDRHRELENFIADLSFVACLLAENKETSRRGTS